MLYQFLDWRMGLHRQMCMVDVERLFARLRESNGGTLPYCLTRWEQVQIFAGESAITLPEYQAVAESLIATDMYPAVTWLREKYEEMLKWMTDQKEYKPLLTDPPRTAPTPTLTITDPKTLTKTGTEFDSRMEGSVSNTQVKPCLEPDPATSSHTSMPTDLPNFSLTGKNRPRQRQPN
jgi:hypothetical protein